MKFTKNSDVLVFTIATNGYDHIFKEYIISQEKYARRNAYDFRVFRGIPENGISGSDSAWLKVPLIIKALEEGYQWIAFFDSDCLLFDHTPRVESVEEKDKYLYMAKDCRMEIPNTGVMIAKNNSQVLATFKRILRWSDLPLKLLPKKHWALYEMGHVVHFTISKTFFNLIDQRWNDTVSKYKDHYVLHAHGSYSKKQRSKEEPLTLWESMLVRVKQGLRYNRLKRLSNYYWGL